MTARRRSPAGRRRARRPAAAPRTASAPAPSAEETRLLGLARELGALHRSAPAPALEAALERLGAAAGRPEPAATLAAAWAREQVREALEEILERAAAAGAMRGDLPRATLAWLLVAAGELLAGEPPDAVPDRLQALRDLLRSSGARPAGPPPPAAAARRPGSGR